MRTVRSCAPLYVSTCFNSVYTMLLSIDNVYDEVTVQLTSSDDLSYISNIKRKTIKSVCKELRRFDEATKKLAAETCKLMTFVIGVLAAIGKSKHRMEAKDCNCGGAFLPHLSISLERVSYCNLHRSLSHYIQLDHLLQTCPEASIVVFLLFFSPPFSLYHRFYQVVPS
jgi:hypothetical protein